MKFPKGKKRYLIFAVLLVLIGIRAALPTLIQRYVNRKLDEVPEYSGRIGEIDLHLFRGAYQIEDVDILKTSGDVPVPFFSAQTVDLSVQWGALFEGALVGEIDFKSPKINFVKGPTEATTQVGVDKPWTDTVRELFPLKINRLSATNGEIHYRDFHASPKVDVMIDQVELTATNLTNSEDLSGTLVADLAMTGRVLQEAPANLDMKLDPYAEEPTFDLNLKMDTLSLTKLNELTRAYAGFDFEQGTLTVAAEMASSEGNFEGYVKPIFNEMKILKLESDAKEGPIHVVWEGLVGGLSKLLRNQPRETFATKIPLSGRYEDPRPDVLPTIGNVFRHAFVEAFEGDIEGTIDLEDASRKAEKEDSSPSENDGNFLGRLLHQSDEP